MPAEWNQLLARLSRSDLQKLLDIKTKIEDLEARRRPLLEELASIEKKLNQLTAGTAVSDRRGFRRKTKAESKRKAGTGRPKNAKAKPKVKAKTKPKPGLRAGTRAKKTLARAGGRLKLEDLVIAILHDHGGSMPFKDLLAAIIKDKRFRSRSKNFDSVLRRTLSTSDNIKRKSRGVYEV